MYYPIPSDVTPKYLSYVPIHVNCVLVSHCCQLAWLYNMPFLLQIELSSRTVSFIVKCRCISVQLCPKCLCWDCCVACISILNLHFWTVACARMSLWNPAQIFWGSISMETYSSLRLSCVKLCTVVLFQNKDGLWNSNSKLVWFKHIASPGGHFIIASCPLGRYFRKDPRKVTAKPSAPPTSTLIIKYPFPNSTWLITAF